MRTCKILIPLCLASSLAMGQSADETEPPALSGPKVRAQGEQPAQAFMPSEQELRQRKAAEARSLPRILRQMSGPRAEASIRLSPDQLQSMRSIREGFNAEIAEYVEQRRTQLLSDLRQLGADQAARRLEHANDLPASQMLELLGGVPQEVLTKMAAEKGATDLDRRALYRSLSEPQREALQRLNALQQDAPSGDQVQEALLKELTPAQRTHIQQQFAQMHAAQARDNRKRQMAQDMRETDRVDAAPGSEMAMSDDQIQSPAGPDRLDRLIAELLPAEREMLADFIERRLLQNRQGRGRDKPAPAIDELTLPKSGGGER